MQLRLKQVEAMVHGLAQPSEVMSTDQCGRHDRGKYGEGHCEGFAHRCLVQVKCRASSRPEQR